MNRCRLLVLLGSWGAAALTLAVVSAAAGLLLATSLSGQASDLTDALVPSLTVSLGALVLALPPGMGLAVLLDQGLVGGRAVDLARRLVWALDGVPSLVYGVAVALIAYGGGVSWASLTLALVVLPGLVTAVERAIDRTRVDERVAALALGATPLQVLLFVVGPPAVPALFASVLRTLGRLLGMAAPLLLLDMGSARVLPVEAVHHAAAGHLGTAALAALLLVVSTGLLYGLAAWLDREQRWEGQA